MENVVVCDRDETVIKNGDKAFKVTVSIESGANKFTKTIDACEACAGFVARNVAQRVFLNDSMEAEILKAISCAPAKKSTKKGKTSEKAEKTEKTGKSAESK